jgi:hypothetical protein
MLGRMETPVTFKAVIIVILLMVCHQSHGQTMIHNNLTYSPDNVEACKGYCTELGNWTVGKIRGYCCDTDSYLRLNVPESKIALLEISYWADWGYAVPLAFALLTEKGTEVFSLLFYRHEEMFSHQYDLFEPFRLYQHVLSILETNKVDDEIQISILRILLKDTFFYNKCGSDGGFYESIEYDGLNYDEISVENIDGVLTLTRTNSRRLDRNVKTVIKDCELLKEFQRYLGDQKNLSLLEVLNELYVFSDRKSLESTNRRLLDRDTLIALFLYLDSYNSSESRQTIQQ